MERAQQNGSAGRVVVTGAAGLIGSALVRHLNLAGVDDVIAVDRLGTSEKWRHLVPLRFADYLDAEEFFARIAGEPGRVRRDRDRVPPRRVLLDDRARRVLPDREQRAPLAGDRALVVRARRALRLRVVGGDVRRARDATCARTSTRTACARSTCTGTPSTCSICGCGARGCSTARWRIKYFNVYGPNEDHKGTMRSVVAKAYDQIRERGVIELFKSYRARHRRRRADARLPVRQGRRGRHGVPRARAARRRASTTSARASSARGTISRTRCSPRSSCRRASSTSRCPTCCAESTSTAPSRRSTGCARRADAQPLTSLEDAVRDYVRNYLVTGAVLGSESAGASSPLPTFSATR